MNRKVMAGFTLIELMVVVVIVGILATIAWPAYQEYVYKSRRADATTMLLKIQQAQERWRTNNDSYATLAQLTGINAAIQATSASGYYTIEVAGNNETVYTATATAVGVQARDSACGTITLNQAGPVVDTAARKKCWGQ